MEIFELFILYLIFGCMWALWIEWFTTKHKIGPQWSNFERYYQLFTWPHGFLVFVYTWINEVIKAMGEDE